MAKYNLDNFNPNVDGMGFPLTFFRDEPNPLDGTSIFPNLVAAQTYAKDPKDVAYVGQILAVISENGQGTVDIYVIENENGDLKPINQSTNIFYLTAENNELYDLSSVKNEWIKINNNLNIHKVIHDNNKYIAITENNGILYSYDGKIWIQTNINNGWFWDICWNSNVNNPIYLATSKKYKKYKNSNNVCAIFKSFDGINWEISKDFSDTYGEQSYVPYITVSCKNNFCIAAYDFPIDLPETDPSYFTYKTDTENKTSIITGVDEQNINNLELIKIPLKDTNGNLITGIGNNVFENAVNLTKITYKNKIFNKGKIFYSYNNAETWIESNVPVQTDINGILKCLITVSDGEYPLVIVSVRNNILYYKQAEINENWKDINWSQCQGECFNNNSNKKETACWDLIFDNIYLAASYGSLNGDGIIWSDDGINWHAATGNISFGENQKWGRECFTTIELNNKKYYFTANSFSAEPYNIDSIQYSTDGKTWHDFGLQKINIRYLFIADDKLFAVTNNNTDIYYKNIRINKEEKQYIDNKINDLDKKVVHIEHNETINGIKTFANGIKLDSLSSINDNSIDLNNNTFITNKKEFEDNELITKKYALLKIEENVKGAVKFINGINILSATDKSFYTNDIKSPVKSGYMYVILSGYVEYDNSLYGRGDYLINKNENLILDNKNIQLSNFCWINSQDTDVAKTTKQNTFIDFQILKKEISTNANKKYIVNKEYVDKKSTYVGGNGISVENIISNNNIINMIKNTGVTSLNNLSNNINIISKTNGLIINEIGSNIELSVPEYILNQYNVNDISTYVKLSSTDDTTLIIKKHDNYKKNHTLLFTVPKVEIPEPIPQKSVVAGDGIKVNDNGSFIVSNIGVLSVNGLNGSIEINSKTPDILNITTDNNIINLSAATQISTDISGCTGISTEYKDDIWHIYNTGVLSVNELIGDITISSITPDLLTLSTDGNIIKLSSAIQSCDTSIEIDGETGISVKNKDDIWHIYNTGVLSVNELIGDITISSITPDLLTLSTDGQIITLSTAVQSSDISGCTGISTEYKDDIWHIYNTGVLSVNGLNGSIELSSITPELLTLSTDGQIITLSTAVQSSDISVDGETGISVKNKDDIWHIYNTGVLSVNELIGDITISSITPDLLTLSTDGNIIKLSSAIQSSDISGCTGISTEYKDDIWHIYNTGVLSVNELIGDITISSITPNTLNVLVENNVIQLSAKTYEISNDNNISIIQGDGIKVNFDDLKYTISNTGVISVESLTPDILKIISNKKGLVQLSAKTYELSSVSSDILSCISNDISNINNISNIYEISNEISNITNISTYYELSTLSSLSTEIIHDISNDISNYVDIPECSCNISSLSGELLSCISNDISNYVPPCSCNISSLSGELLSCISNDISNYVDIPECSCNVETMSADMLSAISSEIIDLVPECSCDISILSGELLSCISNDISNYVDIPECSCNISSLSGELLSCISNDISNYVDIPECSCDISILSGELLSCISNDISNYVPPCSCNVYSMSADMLSAISGDIIDLVPECSCNISSLSGELLSCISNDISNYVDIPECSCNVPNMSADILSAISSDMLDLIPESPSCSCNVENMSADMFSAISSDMLDLIPECSCDISILSGELLSCISNDISNYIPEYSSDISAISGDLISAVSGDLISAISSEIPNVKITLTPYGDGLKIGTSDNQHFGLMNTGVISADVGDENNSFKFIDIKSKKIPGCYGATNLIFKSKGDIVGKHGISTQWVGDNCEISNTGIISVESVTPEYLNISVENNVAKLSSYALEIPEIRPDYSYAELKWKHDDGNYIHVKGILTSDPPPNNEEGNTNSIIWTSTNEDILAVNLNLTALGESIYENTPVPDSVTSALNEMSSILSNSFHYEIYDLSCKLSAEISANACSCNQNIATMSLVPDEVNPVTALSDIYLNELSVNVLADLIHTWYPNYLKRHPDV